MRKENKKPSACRTLKWRLFILIFTLWFVCVGILTWYCAADMQQQMKTILNYCLNSHSFDRQTTSTLPGALETSMISHLGTPYLTPYNIEPLLPILKNPFSPDYYSTNDMSWDEWMWHNGYEAAVIYYNTEEEILIQTGDYLRFTYTSDEKWNELSPTELGYSYIALDEVPGGDKLCNQYISLWPLFLTSENYFLPLLRLTGYFEGNEFRPAKIERIMLNPSYGIEINLAFLAKMDAKHNLAWETILTAEAADNAQLETIYAWNVESYSCLQHEVSVGEKNFVNLTDLLNQEITNKHSVSYQKNSLLESVFVDHKSNQDDHGQYTVAVAIRCKPLQYAFSQLLFFYICSLALTILCSWFIHRFLKKNLATPVDHILRSAVQGKPIDPSAKYAEIYGLEKYYSETHNRLFENNAEIQRLSTALNYAHGAEEKRKQLISDITHELKTPLAVIHSYAECLQEDIAKQKQEQYLQTIMEQTERMDTMVLQMLELSRLEAGKVRLSLDQFSLLGLTKAVAEKMDLLFKARNLQVIYHWAQDFIITADEARMEQVITNLLSNAQKYTTEGGVVRIKTRMSGGSIYFYIENSSEHLSKEALEKVWDSFYRTDSSRNTAGTGLGLSIVKSIITLHGGKCEVRNTWINDEIRAVEFGFVLPMK